MAFPGKTLTRAAICAAFAFGAFQIALAQVPIAATGLAVSGPKVTQIDIEGLRRRLKPNGKPLMINFWATWCIPCTEEFPDLVKIDKTYKGKIDFLTVSLDDVTEINTYAPKFLGDIKSAMPAILLTPPAENAGIEIVSQ